MHKVMTLMLIAGLLVACAAPASNPPLDLAERFRLVAFRDDAGRPNPGLYRWEVPVRVQVTGMSRYDGDVRAHLVVLRELTGLEIVGRELQTVTDDDRPMWLADIEVMLWPRSRLEPILDGFLGEFDMAMPNLSDAEICFFALSGGHGVVFIDASLPASIVRGCITEELTQVFGLVGDLDGLTDTAFSKTGTDHLTAADRALVAILYDERLRGGMDEATAMPIVRAIIAERYPDGP